MKYLLTLLLTPMFNPILFGSNSEHSIYSQEKLEITSKALGTQKSIYLGLPPGYSTDKKYPVAYVLDADYIFNPVLGQIQLNSYWGKYPETIIVGVPHLGNRFEDLSVAKNPDFYEFFTKELTDYINANYSVSGFDILVSHSLSGYFSSEVLIRDTKLFDAFLNISPALYKKLVPQIDSVLTDHKSHIYYYLSTAENDLRGHIDIAFNARNALRFRQNEWFDFKFDFIEKKTHVSLVPSSVINGLDHIFSLYQATDWRYLEELKENGVDIESYFSKKYEKIATLYGVTVDLREEECWAISDFLIFNKLYERAIAFGKKLINKGGNHVFIGEGIVGEAYENKKDYPNALIHYKNMYNALPEDIVNKSHFMADVERVESLINQ